LFASEVRSVAASLSRSQLLKSIIYFTLEIAGSAIQKKVKKRIVTKIYLRTTERHLSMGSDSVMCRPPRLHPNRAGWYSINRPHKNERL